MRPNILNPLFKPIDSLDKIGEKTKKSISEICDGENIVDVLTHVPRDYIIRKHISSLSEAFTGDNIIVKLRVLKHNPPARHSRSPYRINTTDGHNYINIVYFRAHSKFLNDNFPEGEEVYVAGKVEEFGNQKQITHPEFVAKDLNNIPMLQAVYRLTANLTQTTFLKIVKDCIKQIPKLDEWLSKDIMKQHNFNSFNQSLLNIHTPTDKNSIGQDNLNRLAYDELLANQITIAINRKNRDRLKTESLVGNNKTISQVLNNLPFDLTNAQKNALNDIRTDMAKKTPMNRLLQGDVGSGKTVIALFCMLIATEEDKQACIMAPTEVLANQHYKTIKELVKNTDIRVELLTGSSKTSSRKEINAGLKNGEINIIVGTHALFQDEVIYKNLSLCVIDEQHRFGVEQRLKLTNKGKNPHILAMTATPIPRTLLMSVFGDMESSKIDEKPIGRKPIDTRIISSTKIDEVAKRLKNAIRNNQQIYWVCPLVEESELIELTSVQQRYEYLCREFGETQVELIHGKMKVAEKGLAMKNFTEAKAKILVATTVIEVGVDVSGASIMIIEHAERFGLSQLHQLRGRIGRSELQSTCLLIYKKLSEISKKRLEIIRSHNDGFYISEADLELRGPGDILGTRQSGLPELKFADLHRHKDLLEIAKKDAQYLIEADPTLESKQGKIIRLLLYIFKMDKSILNLKQ